LKYNSDVIQILLSAITVVLSFIAVGLAWYIPRRIMMNQLYSDMIKEYRSTEMGGAIFSIFRFYVTDCENNIRAIASEYKKKYEEQIDKPLI
jgi:hypothetical protein